MDSSKLSVFALQEKTKEEPQWISYMSSRRKSGKIPAWTLKVNGMDEIKSIIDKITDSLSNIQGVRAVVLGGSRARGTHTVSSDIDVGIYYDASSLDIGALNQAAQAVDDSGRENLITPPGGWGEWVNGGGWLVVEGRPVDFILRDLARVEGIVRECREGIVSSHYQTGHPHAFINAMYMGELAVCKVLWEKDDSISAVKDAAEQYPSKLQKALVHLFSFEAEFSLWLAENSLDKDDIYYVTAHMVRSVSALNQVLFALNREYCLNEKKAVAMIDRFSIRPAGYKGKVDSIFLAAGIGGLNACNELRELVNEVKSLLTVEQTGHIMETIGDLSSSKGNPADR